MAGMTEEACRASRRSSSEPAHLPLSFSPGSRSQLGPAPVQGTADLYPGFTGGDLYFTLTNPNPYTITFASMTPGAVTVTGGVGCLPTHITVAPATGLSLVSPPGTSGQLSILDVVTMVAGAPDACQAATFNVTLTLTGTQT
jgi:hypothetical protein